MGLQSDSTSERVIKFDDLMRAYSPEGNIYADLSKDDYDRIVAKVKDIMYLKKREEERREIEQRLARRRRVLETGKLAGAGALLFVLGYLIGKSR